MIMSFFKLPLSIGVSLMKRGDDKYNLNHRTYGNFNIKKDINYISDDTKEHRLDIYTNPVKSNGIMLFYVHGGAYVYSWKETHRVFLSWMVDQGFTVVSINYRLGQKDGSISIMDQVKDSLAALSFIEENKNYYGIKTDNLFLVGDSAGGHICMMVDILLKSKEAQAYYKLDTLPLVNIKGVAVNSTMYDYSGVVSQAKKMLFKKGCRWMLSSGYLDDEFIKNNNPRYYYRNGFKPSPIFASTSYHDYFNSQTFKLKRDADELGMPLEYLFEPSLDKKINHVYNLFNLETEEGKKCNNAMVEFFVKNSKVAK